MHAPATRVPRERETRRPERERERETRRPQCARRARWRLFGQPPPAVAAGAASVRAPPRRRRGPHGPRRRVRGRRWHGGYPDRSMARNRRRALLVKRGPAGRRLVGSAHARRRRRLVRRPVRRAAGSRCRVSQRRPVPAPLVPSAAGAYRAGVGTATAPGRRKTAARPRHLLAAHLTRVGFPPRVRVTSSRRARWQAIKTYHLRRIWGARRLRVASASGAPRIDPDDDGPRGPDSDPARGPRRLRECVDVGGSRSRDSVCVCARARVCDRERERVRVSEHRETQSARACATVSASSDHP